MRITYFVTVTLFCCFALSGCTKSQSPTPAPKAIVSNTVTVSIEEFESLKNSVASLERQVMGFRDYLETDPKYLLHTLDHDLDAVERDEEPIGSFTDWFVPNAYTAMKVGAATAEVQARFERAIALAEQGKYISAYMANLMNTGGPEAVRNYAGVYPR